MPRPALLGFFVAALLFSFGCAQKEADQSAPAQAPAPSLTPGDVSIELQGLASVMKGEVIPARPHRPGVLPLLNGEPEHLRYHFDEDSLTPGIHFRERQLLVYPIGAYRELFQGAERDSFNAEIAQLQDLLKDRPSRVNDTIPVLPAVAADQLFNARVEYLELNGGAGIRFVTRYAGGVGPGLFYTFQGIVGNYYIAFFWPATAHELPESRPAPRIASYLEGLTEDEFDPKLEEIDKIVESIQVRDPGVAPPSP